MTDSAENGCGDVAAEKPSAIASGTVGAASVPQDSPLPQQVIRDGGLGSAATLENGRRELTAVIHSLDRLQEAVDSSTSRIHYQANWLARYEFALDAEDTGLKIVESKRIEEEIRERGLWGGIASHLDVGTCTGRHLLLLREAVKEDGLIIGIDDDPDCVEFARGNIRKHCPSDPRISIARRDFLARELVLPDVRFQLITCMMSTISHFGKDRKAGFADALQCSLRRLAELLDDDGLLIFSTWSQFACDSRRFLSIYDEQDCERLAQWTPPEAELQIRLREAGLVVCALSRPDRRLNLWVCRRSPSAQQGGKRVG